MQILLIWLDVVLLLFAFVIAVAFGMVILDPSSTIRQPHGTIMGVLALAAIVCVYLT